MKGNALGCVIKNLYAVVQQYTVVYQLCAKSQDEYVVSRTESVKIRT